MSPQRLPTLIVLGALVLPGCADEGRPDSGVPWNPTGITGQDGSEASGDVEDESSSTTPPDDSTPTTDDPTTGLTAADGGESSSGGMVDPPPTPYQGGWDIGTCQDMVSSSIPDMSLTDQFGDSVRIYDFCHKAILLVGGAFW